MNLHLEDSIKGEIERSSDKSLFKYFMGLSGECVRSKEGRVTQRVIINKKIYYVKQHRGVGWREIFKNMLQLRFPVTSAKNEWVAIQKLEQMQIPVANIAAYGTSGFNPASKQSFILTGELAPTISLEDLSRVWKKQPPSFLFKRFLIKQVALIAKKLHENGINHRDFYLCHFLLDTSKTINDKNLSDCKIYLIDLHRAQIREKTPLRWIIKDVASLYFSSMDIGLTRHDLYYFMKIYRGKNLRDVITNEKAFWDKVTIRGERLYRNNKQ